MWPQWVWTEANLILSKVDFTRAVPDQAHVLRFTELKPQDIKIVIIGQDPYATPGAANGRAFAVNKGRPLPPSLRTLFAEIQATFGHIYTDETLEHWMLQGVLLLNAALTTEVNIPGAHQALWAPYIAKLVQWLDINYPHLIWVLWGRQAATVASAVKGRKIFDAHPSPLSTKYRRGDTFKQLPFIQW